MDCNWKFVVSAPMASALSNWAAIARSLLSCAKWVVYTLTPVKTVPGWKMCPAKFHKSHQVDSCQCWLCLCDSVTVPLVTLVTAKGIGAVHASVKWVMFSAFCLQVMLKCADIGHLTSDLTTHKRWVSRLEEEFFKQVSCSRLLIQIIWIAILNCSVYYSTCYINLAQASWTPTCKNQKTIVLSSTSRTGSACPYPHHIADMERTSQAFDAIIQKGLPCWARMLSGRSRKGCRSACKSFDGQGADGWYGSISGTVKSCFEIVLLYWTQNGVM